MRLLRARLARIHPFADLELSFAEDEVPRAVTVVVGGGGTGKTSLAHALASTRPGHAVSPVRERSKTELAPFVATEWLLGDDEPRRTHPLVVASPQAAVEADEVAAIARRREQALYDRLAERGGFAFAALPAARWFSRSPIVLGPPERSFLRHDPRPVFASDDPTRADLARETKQLLAYAELDRALGEGALSAALTSALAEIAPLAGVGALSLEVRTLEPLFETPAGKVPFDALPQATRQLLALPVLALRAVRASRPEGDPRAKEAVVVVDEAALHLPEHVVEELPGALERALPRVQWILLSSSEALARGASPGAVIALRRDAPAGRVAAHTGPSAVLH